MGTLQPGRSRAAIILVWMTALLGAEVASRIFLPAPGFQPWVNPNLPGLRVPHPIRGFAHAPNFSGRRVSADYSHALVTNALGMRDEPFDPRQSGWRILAVGDSFTEGVGVDHDEAWPEQLEQRLSARRLTHVWNAGITSYSVLQMRQAAAEYMPIIRPDLIIAGIYPLGGTRLSDPFVLLGEGVVRRSALARVRLAPQGYRYSVFDRPWLMALDFRVTDSSWLAGHLLHQTQHLRDRLAGRPALNPEHARMVTDAPIAMQALLDEIGQLQALAHDAGTPLLILLVNGQQADGTFRAVDRELNEHIKTDAIGRDIRVVDPLPALVQAAGGKPVMRFPTDGHWTPLAHGIAAAEVARVLERHPDGFTRHR